jgi:hypothetical protein
MQTLRIKVKPNARDASLSEGDDGTWVATVKSPPVEGKANEELCRLVAERFGVARGRVKLQSGSRSRIKIIIVDLS